MNVYSNEFKQNVYKIRVKEGCGGEFEDYCDRNNLVFRRYPMLCDVYSYTGSKHKLKGILDIIQKIEPMLKIVLS